MEYWSIGYSRKDSNIYIIPLFHSHPECAGLKLIGDSSDGLHYGRIDGGGGVTRDSR